MSGSWRFFSNDGFLFEVIKYMNGLENGIATTFYPSGAVRCKTSYVDGLSEGVRQSFYPDGQIRVQHTYKSGKLQGKGHAWSKEGQLIVEFNDVNGKEKERAFYDGLSEDEAWDLLLDISKVEDKRGISDHDTGFVLFPCGYEDKAY